MCTCIRVHMLNHLLICTSAAAVFREVKARLSCRLRLGHRYEDQARNLARFVRSESEGPQNLSLFCNYSMVVALRLRPYRLLTKGPSRYIAPLADSGPGETCLHPGKSH